MLTELIRARAFATWHHQGQTYGRYPYTHHLRTVSDVLIRFGYPLEGALQRGDASVVRLHMAAWLHDVVEDTEATVAGVRSAFGVEVAGLVEAVTDAPGATRFERKSGTYPRIRAFGEPAVTLKLADRIANVESSRVHSPRLFDRYRVEQTGFEEALRAGRECEAMWEQLHTVLGFGQPNALLQVA